MKQLNRLIKGILSSESSKLDALSEHLSNVKITSENKSDLMDIVQILEMREKETRNIRQNLTTRLRTKNLSFYAEYLRKIKNLQK